MLYSRELCGSFIEAGVTAAMKTASIRWAVYRVSTSVGEIEREFCMIIQK
jgi:hypothetical protein